MLVVSSCDRNDAGRYELLMENSAGSKVMGVNVRVLDSPGPVQNLEVKEVRRDGGHAMTYVHAVTWQHV